MAANGQTGEKTEDATPKRKLDARKKGQASKSIDLSAAAGLMLCAFMLPGALMGAGEGLMMLMGRLPEKSTAPLTPESAMQLLGTSLWPVLAPTLPLIFALMAVGVAGNLAQVGLLFSAEPLKPKWEKINPLEGAKRMFSKKALFEGFKAIFKLGVFSWIAYAVVAAEWDGIATLTQMSAQSAGKLIHDIAFAILIRIGLAWLVLAGLDYFFQRKDFEKNLKMTKHEVKQEYKEQEGSPETKLARQKQRGKLKKGSLKSQLAEATAIVTNPTHFAVALKYDRDSMGAPVVIAKGQDYLALKIREIAGELGVPLVENKPLARALYRECEPGDVIPRSLFAGVAEVLAYVYRTSERHKRRAG
ncbi:MAG: flagellar biosynthesis protein FlhB [Fimbriimonadaceae bacterium]|nr:flagellar biosynthesis protein FlhB [Fimbriimonadaceae bacterium]